MLLSELAEKLLLQSCVLMFIQLFFVSGLILSSSEWCDRAR